MKRLLLLMLSLVLVVALVVGCTDTPKTTTKSDGSGEEVLIEFFQQKEAAAVEPFNEVLKGFMEKNPGIVIEQTYVPDAPQVFASRVASGDIPDLFSHWPERSTYWELAKQGIMLAQTGQDYLKNIDPNLLERGMYDGEVYCLPIALLTFGVVYNIEIYENLDLEIPETWTDFIAILDTLKENDIGGISFQMQHNEGMGQQINAIYKMALGDYNANVFFAELARGETTFADHPETIEAIKKYLEMTTYKSADSMANHVQEMCEELVNGEAAHFYSGTWNFGSLAGIDENFEYAMYPLPLYDDTSKNIAPVGIDAALCISATTEYEEELLKLMDYIGNDEGAYLYCKTMNNQPADKTVDYVVDQMAPMVETLNAGKIFRFPHHFWRPGVDLSMANELITLILSDHTDADIETYCSAVENIFTAEGPSEFQDDYTEWK